MEPILGALSIAGECSAFVRVCKRSSSSYTGPDGFGEFRLPDFKTIGKKRWYGCQSYAPAAFTHQEIFLVLISIRG